MNINVARGWTLTTVGDLAVAGEQPVLTGPFGSGLGTADFQREGIPVLTIGCLTQSGITLDKALFVSLDKADALARYRVRHGDVLFSRMATLGRAAVVGPTLGGALINYHLMRLRLDSTACSAQFLVYYVQGAAAVRDHLRNVAHGATRPGINTKELLALPVLLPPRAEQDRIVSEIDKQFSRLDAAVAALKRAQANLKRYRAAVLQAAVEGRLGCCGPPQRRGALPPGWERRPLGSLLAAPLRNGHSAKATVDGSGIPTLTLSAVTENDFSAKNIKYTAADPSRVADLWLQPDDILIERSNTPQLVGTAARFPGRANTAIFPDLLIRVRLNEQVRPRFLEAVLRAESLRRYFRASAQGIAGTMPKIDQTVVESAIIPVPTLQEQDWIIEELDRHLSVITEVEAAVRGRLRTSASLRGSLLGVAFSGRLVPQDPHDEPASALLERIRAERGSSPTRKPTARRKPELAVV